MAAEEAAGVPSDRVVVAGFRWGAGALLASLLGMLCLLCHVVRAVCPMHHPSGCLTARVAL